MRCTRLPVCFSALLLASLSVFGQQSSECLQRTVTVGIVDDHGTVPHDLISRNFTLTYGRKSVSLPTAVYSEGPRRVMVLLDVSGSMRGPEAKQHSKWEIARAAARSLFSSLPTGSAAGLLTFTDKIKTRAPLSIDRRLAEEWLDNDTAHQVPTLKGRTAMYDAIEDALKQLEPTEPGDAIYIITDAGENASAIRRSRVENSLAAAGIRLFAFLLASPEPMPFETDGASELQLLAINSGGFVQIASPKDVRRGQPLTQGVPAIDFRAQYSNDSGFAYDEPTREQIRLHTNLLNLWISSFYLLTFQTQEAAKPKHLDITVVDSQGHSRKDLTLAYSHIPPDCAIVPTHH